MIMYQYVIINKADKKILFVGKVQGYVFHHKIKQKGSLNDLYTKVADCLEQVRSFI